MTTAEYAYIFRRQGYCVVADFLTSNQLEMLRAVSLELLSETSDGDQKKFAQIGLGEDRRFLRQRHRDYPQLQSYLMSSAMKDFAANFLGEEVYLFNEQFVVKGPKTGAAFGWHQDSYYVGFDHQPYLTIWIALDDICQQNGPVYILPRDLDEDQGITEHRWVEANSNFVGYFGDQTGEQITCSAGTAVVFSSVTLHCSSPNISEQSRRAYICQYSAQPILEPGTGKPKHFALRL